MTLLYIDKATYDRLKAQDDGDGCIEDSVYGWMRMRWYQEHGEGFFLSYCCGEAAIPDGLILGPGAAAVAQKNVA